MPKRKKTLTCGILDNEGQLHKNNGKETFLRLTTVFFPFIPCRFIEIYEYFKEFNKRKKLLVKE